MFRVGDIEADLTLNRTPFEAGLRAARMEAQRFEREGITATVNLDAANAERRLAEIDRDRTINADLDLDTAAAEARLLLLQRQAASIGGGGVGGTGGGGGGILGPGGFFRPSPLLAGGALAASFLPTLGASAVQGALGAGALGLGGAAAAGVGGAGILAAAKPAVTALGNVTTAQTNLNKAIATYGKDSAQAKTATKELQAAQSLLPKSGQQVASSLQDIQSRWSRLSLPAQNQFFGMLQDGLHQAEQLLPGFARSADTSMTAARGAFDHFLGIFNTPDFHTFEHTMTQTFAAGIGPFERGVENIGHVLERIAVAVAPDVLRMLQGFQDVTHGWEQDTRNAADLQHHVHETVQQFGDWYDLATSLGHLLSALFITNEQGARKGGQEVEAMARQLNAWSRWIEHHHHEITHFFGELNDAFGLLLSSAGEIASVVLPAFKPVADIIHEVVTDLNSIKVGNISALTVLLGAMAGSSLLRRLPGGGGGVGVPPVVPVGGGGLLARLGGRFGLPSTAGGAVVAGGAAAIGLGTYHALTDEGGILDTLHGHATANLSRELGAQISQSIADGIHRDRSAQRAIDGMTIGELQSVRHGALAQAHSLGTDAAQTLGNAVSDEGRKVARETATMAAQQIHALNLGTRMADAVAEGHGDVRKILNRYENDFEKLPPTVQDAAVKSAKNELDSLQQMGLITHKQERQTLNDLEDMQAKSLKKQRQKWADFGQTVDQLVTHWFGNMAGTVNTILGNKGITGMVNQLLTGVGSQHELKWNATTAGRVAGTLAGFLGIGGQRGGFTGGWSSFDDRMVPMRGNEAILRGEDHVPLVSRALQATYGFTLGDLFARTGGTGGIGGYARGGAVKLLPGVNMTVGSEPTILNDLRAFAGLEGKTVYVISGYRSPAHSVAVGGFANDPHTQGKAADIGLGAPTLASMMSLGLEGPLNRVGLHRPYYPPSSAEANHVELLAGGGGGVVGGIGQIPRIIVHGPRGAIRNGLQGTADLARREANRFLMQQMAAVSTAGGLGPSVPEGPIQQMARQMINRIWDPSQWPPFNALEMQEAGWNPRAVNPSSGAAGLAQALPPSKYPPGAWPYTGLHSAELQLQWMMGYIKDRYGNPAGAWSHEQSAGWYAQGGDFTVDRPTIFGAGESGVERVSIRPAGQETMPRLDPGRALGSPQLSAEVHIHGDIVPHPGYEDDPVQVVLSDERFYDAIQGEIDGNDAFGSQLERMNS